MEAIEYHNMSIELMEAGDWEEALELLEVALEEYPEVPLFWANFAFCMIELGDDRGAEQILRQAINMNNKNEFAWYNLAGLYHTWGKNGKASKCFEACAECKGELENDARERYLRHSQELGLGFGLISELNGGNPLLKELTLSMFAENDFDRKRARGFREITLDDVDEIDN